MTYYTAGYATVFRVRTDAERLLRDRCPNHPEKWPEMLSSISTVEIDAQLLYNSMGLHRWSLWSDSKIRQFVVAELHEPECWRGGPLAGLMSDRPIKVADSPLRPGGAQFIQAILGSDGGRVPVWTGSLRDAKELPTIAMGGDRGVYARDKLSPYDLTMADGSSKRVWVRTVGYFEGYLFDVYDTQEEVVRDISQ